MKLRIKFWELLIIVTITAVMWGIFFRPIHHHRLRQVKEQEMYGYWIAIPSAHELFRLFLTNNGGGWLGSREIYTNLYRVTSWNVTNNSISINLEAVSEPTWPHEYIRGKVGLYYNFAGVRGGVNQAGQKWDREIAFYREETVLQDFGAVVNVMSNRSQVIERNAATDGSKRLPSDTNSMPSSAGSNR